MDLKVFHSITYKNQDCMQVEYTYMDGFLKYLSSRSKARSHELRIHVVFFKKKNNKNLTLQRGLFDFL